MKITGALPLRSSALLALLMIAGLWPLLYLGEPSYITDSSSYYRGGQAAWEKVTALLPSASGAADGAPPIAGDPSEHVQVIGLRSLVYSVATFALSAPGTSLVLLVLLQAAVSAYLVWLLLRAYGIADRRSAFAFPLLLGGASSLPIFNTLAAPDVWAGLMVIALVLLTLHRAALHTFERLIVGAILSFAVASHASHILSAMSALALAAILLAARRLKPREALRSLRLSEGSIALAAGIALAFLSSLIAFGEASPAPKRYPFALARAIEDGPAKWYLDEHCALKRYAVCELFPDGMPGGVGDFLWADGGISRRATPEQMERIRTEELEILRNAVAAYPMFQLQASARNVVRQFAYVAIEPERYQGIRLDDQGHVQDREPLRSSLEWHFALQHAAVGASLLIILAAVWRSPSALMNAIAISLVLIVINTLICAIFSAPDVRYQARTLWVLPVLAGLLVFVRIDKQVS
jgi:hypothetical protein